ncbi:hypothetical protein [Streptomyces cinereoruber]
MTATYVCEQVLGIEPVEAAETPKPSMSQAQRWAMHLTAPSSSSSARDS